MNLFNITLAWEFSGLAWGFLAVVSFFLSLLLMGVILIQDSKDTGLTSAFGGGGGTALMGARMQKDLAKFTGIMAGVLIICLTIMGLITAGREHRTIGASGATQAPPDAPTSPAPGANPLGGFGGGLGGLGDLKLDGGLTPEAPAGSTPIVPLAPAPATTGGAPAAPRAAAPPATPGPATPAPGASTPTTSAPAAAPAVPTPPAGSATPPPAGAAPPSTPPTPPPKAAGEATKEAPPPGQPK